VTNTASQIAIVMMFLALLLNLWRLLRGPSAVDRITALDTMYVNTIALLVLLGVWRGSPLHFEAGLVIAMLGFVGSLTSSAASTGRPSPPHSVSEACSSHLPCISARGRVRAYTKCSSRCSCS
jgi:multicomponent K+:H+ antiporter subunit F